MKTVHTITGNGHSLNKITKAIEGGMPPFFTMCRGKGKWWAADILLQHYIMDLPPLNKQKLKVLIQPIDGTVINGNTVGKINKFDLILTPSTLNKKQLKKNCVNKPIHVVPNFYDEMKDNGYFSSMFLEQKYTFYSETTGIPRKNTSNLIEYFLQEFSKEEKVRLVVKTGSDNIEELKKIILKYPGRAEVKIISEFLKDSDLHSLMLNCDGYICLSHMEGFCIPLLNAAVNKKDIITLNSKISGYMDFIGPDNAYLLEVKEIPIETSFDSMLIFTEQSIWEEPDYLEYRKAMRILVNGTYPFNKIRDYSAYSKPNVLKKYADILMEQPYDFSFGSFYLPKDEGCNWLVNQNLMGWEYWWEDIITTLAPEDNVIDIGSHVGFTATYLGSRIKLGKIFCFEPSPLAYGFLKRNLFLNGIVNAEVINAAVGQSEGMVNFSNEKNLFTNRILPGEGTTKQVCLDDLDLPKIALIKIDTEGFEIAVLKGMLKLLKRDMPKLVIEINHDNYDEISKLLLNIGYKTITAVDKPNKLNQNYLVLP